MTTTIRNDFTHALEAVYDNSMDLITENYLDSSDMLERGKFDEKAVNNIHLNCVLLLDNMKMMKGIIENMKPKKRK